VLDRDSVRADGVSGQMFVFGEVQDPLPETVRMVEDVVRGQIIEIVRPIFAPNQNSLYRVDSDGARSPEPGYSPTSAHPASSRPKT